MLNSFIVGETCWTTHPLIPSREGIKGWVNEHCISSIKTKVSKEVNSVIFKSNAGSIRFSNNVLIRKGYCIRCLFLILLTSLFPLYGYGEIGSKTELSVKSLLKRMDKAIDPTGVLTDSCTRITEAMVYIPSQNFKANVIIKFKMPDKLLIKTKLKDGKCVIQAYNGKIGWNFTEGEKKHKISGKELDSFRLNVGLEACRKNWYSLFRKMEIKENNVKIGEHECYELICYPKKEFNSNTPVIFYIDKKKYLIRKMELSVFSVAGIFHETILVDKYKSFDNVLIPVDTKTNILGTEVLYKINQCTFNEDIRDNEFNF